jgi:hypothetical protein
LLLLDLLALAAQLVPNGKSMRYDTSSQFLVEQWDTMMQWESHGYQGLYRDACPPQWMKIMESLEGRTEGIAIMKSDENMLGHETLKMYALEGIERNEEDAYRRQEAPWF